jgi:hypothetical protein
VKSKYPVNLICRLSSSCLSHTGLENFHLLFISETSRKKKGPYDTRPASFFFVSVLCVGGFPGLNADRISKQSQGALGRRIILYARYLNMELIFAGFSSYLTCIQYIHTRSAPLLWQHNTEAILLYIVNSFCRAFQRRSGIPKPEGRLA